MLTTRRADPLTILQIFISAIGFLLSIVAAFLLGLVGIAGVMGQSTTLSEVTPLLVLAWVAALIAALALPSLLHAVLYLTGWQIPTAWSAAGKAVSGYRLAWGMLLLWPLVLALGNAVQNNETAAWLILPPLGVLAIAIPIGWVFTLTQRKIAGGTPQRRWGLLNLTLYISFPAIFAAEMVGLTLLVTLFVVSVMGQPGWEQQIQQMMQQMQALRGSPDELMRLMQPILTSPVVLYAIFTVYSGMAPLVEEMLKPLAVWVLAGRSITPSEGFVAGALCGATFALLESLLNLPGAASGQWLALVAGRAGTGILHITTTALTGWALACAWRYGAYVRLALTYLLAAFLHALWNALSVLMIFREFPGELPAHLQWAARASTVAPAGLAVLAAACFLTLVLANRRLRAEERRRAAESALPLTPAPKQLPPEPSGPSLP